MIDSDNKWRNQTIKIVWVNSFMCRLHNSSNILNKNLFVIVIMRKKGEGLDNYNIIKHQQLCQIHGPSVDNLEIFQNDMKWAFFFFFNDYYSECMGPLSWYKRNKILQNIFFHPSKQPQTMLQWFRIWFTWQCHVQLPRWSGYSHQWRSLWEKQMGIMCSLGWRLCGENTNLPKLWEPEYLQSAV